MTRAEGKVSWKDSLTGKLLLRFWLSLILVSLFMGEIQYQALHSFLMKGETQALQAQIGSFDVNQLKLWINHKESFPKAWTNLGPGVVAGFFSPDKKLEDILGRQETEAKRPYALERSFFLKQIAKNKLRTTAVFTSPKGVRYLVISGPIYLNQEPVTSLTGQNISLTANSTLIGYAILSAPLTQMSNILDHQLQVFLISTLLILVIGGLLTFYILKKPLQPLSRMSEISDKIAAGNYTLRIPSEPSASEIAHLRSALNQMLETLNRSLATETEAREQMARFIGDASHELRTPLTSIRGFLEILLRNQETDPETLTSAHKSMLTETERLIHLTEDLLTLNRLTKQINQESSSKPETSIQSILPELLPLLNSLLEYRTLEVDVEETSLPVEPGELKQIIYNLVHNAIQHTPVNGVITLKAETKANLRCLSVADNGEGIASQDLPYIFERFYRGSRSRERKAGSGAGLGLAIVWEIVNLRGGRIEAESKQGEGTTFTISFSI
ncbi:signal transduction histidine kinase [Desulfosporosinus acidiphilus SJ4]|uniref:histidine kinase n=1 Tax=Desulfosporosinus acidiphilus (strain DSM 22704 / JCM 16185 / SJ4) TaxID=646529 RepID=I4D1Q5_DESAJ|nr:ATP-binding protein [Desulfosporosinus acidiphilus]AFM39729.1 signal transduction histidine kinase [Desulfosporosinus acidiphilus SJ4]